MKISRTFLILVVCVLFSSCKYNKPSNHNTVDSCSSNSQINIAAHRGDWRNYPENSIEGLKSCIDMGIDIMETDLKMTKDSILILMHDETLDRTTNGSGFVKDISLDSIKKLNLKNGYGFKTPYKIPTLKEALLSAKGKINIDLDKSYSYIQKAFEIVKETQTLNQVIFRVDDSWDVFNAKHSNIIPEINYMPLVWWNTKDPIKFIENYLNAEYPPKIIEVIYKTEKSNQLLALKSLKDYKIKIMMNTIYSHLCANHDDYKALNKRDENWGWVIKNGATIIGTDRPKMLLDYLKTKGLHN